VPSPKEGQKLKMTDERGEDGQPFRCTRVQSRAERAAAGKLTAGSAKSVNLADGTGIISAIKWSRGKYGVQIIGRGMDRQAISENRSRECKEYEPRRLDWEHRRPTAFEM